ncbi:MAG: VOC family protein [Myxococcales bacterium]|nr:VOC family protein [Myxococcales bacterium]
MSEAVARAIHHIALGARDVEQVAGFYRDVFGLPEVARHFTETGELRSVWLSTLGSVLMVERTSEPTRLVTGVGGGPFLLAFRVAPGERAELERRLEQAGAPLESRTAESSYARDPEGNRVAISHYPLPQGAG